MELHPQHLHLALSLCIYEIEKMINENEKIFNQSSIVSRLGSAVLLEAYMDLLQYGEKQNILKIAVTIMQFQLTTITKYLIITWIQS